MLATRAGNSRIVAMYALQYGPLSSLSSIITDIEIGKKMIHATKHPVAMRPATMTKLLIYTI